MTQTRFTIETLPINGAPIDGTFEIVHVLNARPETLTMRAIVQHTDWEELEALLEEEE